MTPQTEFKYPRRRLLRAFLRLLSVPAFALTSRMEIIGRENLPKKGPLLLVGNHFSYIDPVTFVRIARWPIEFLGGAEFAHAPGWVRTIPWLWGYYPLYRGTGSTYALKAAEAILKQGGVLGIFPEAGNWAEVLRPARPGAAFLAALTGAPLLPVGIHGLNDIFPFLKRGQRAKVTLRIGEPFGPFKVSGRGRERRRQLDEIGHEIMRHIAALLPPEKRGHYSDDPAIREAARGTEIYPWADKVEGEYRGEIH
ncbi:MAG: lysophospholipid acyltransferase family protein [Chloroflexota bacterium]